MEFGSDEWINLAEALEKERTDITHANKLLTDEELSFAKFAQGKRYALQCGVFASYDTI